MPGFAVLFPAAGRSSRFGQAEPKKIYAELEGRAVWIRAIEPFVNRGEVSQLLMAIAAEDRAEFERRYRPSVAFFGIQVIDGGAERHESVARMLEHLHPGIDFVAVHDAARPCVPPAVIDAVFQAAIQHGAALPGIPLADTVKRVDEAGRIVETVPRAGLWGVQTPQVFRRDWIEAAYAQPRAESGPTDDAQLVEQVGHPVHVVPGSIENLKITRKEDLALARAILRARADLPRDPQGHPFAQDQAGKLWDDLPRIRPQDLFG